MQGSESLGLMIKGLWLVAAGVSTWAGTAIAALLTPPDSAWMIWLDKYGFPTVVCILLFFAVVFIFKSYCAVQEARIKDRDLSISQFKQEFTDAQSSRLELVQTNRQTVDMLGKVRDELQQMQGLRVYRKKTTPTIIKP